MVMGAFRGVLGWLREHLFPENAELRERNRALELENSALKAQAPMGRPMKRRSPAEWRFRVVSWEWVEMYISPRELPQGKTIRALRVHVPLEDQPTDAPYWDITSKRAQAMLLPILPTIAGTNTYVHFRKDGEGPTSQYSMSVHPA